MLQAEFFKSRYLQPILVLIVACILLAGILIVGRQSFKTAESAVMNEFNQRQLVLAQQTCNGIQQYIDSLVGALQTIARLPDVLQMNEGTLRLILAHEMMQLEPMGVNDIAVIDADGIVRFTAAADHLEGADLSWRTYFQKTKQAPLENPYRLEFIQFKGVDRGNKGVLLCVPLLFNRNKQQTGPAARQFAGVMACTFKLDTLTDRLILPVQSSENSHVYLLNVSGDVLWAPERSLFGKNVQNLGRPMAFLQTMLNKASGRQCGTCQLACPGFDTSTMRYRSASEGHLLAYARINLSDETWLLNLLAPKHDIQHLIKTIYDKQRLLIGVIGLTFLLASIYAFIVSHRYSRKLENDVAAKTKDLGESHSRLLSVLNSLQAHVYVADLETREILFANHSLQKAFGDVVGKICWQVLHTGQCGPCEFCTNNRLLAADGTSAGTNRWDLKNSITQRWYEFRDQAIPWVGNRMVRFVTAMDITDHKLLEFELKRAHREMSIFCRIIKHIGSLETIDGIGAFLIKELRAMLDNHNVALLVFNRYRDILYVLSDQGTKTIKEHDHTQFVADLLEDLNDTAIPSRKLIKKPILPENFKFHKHQTLIPMQVSSHADGALVIECEPNCRCEQNELDLVAIILEQASGTIKRAVQHQEEIRALKDRVENTWEYCGIIGKNPQMQVIYKLINDIAPTDATVLIQGESGTGKELVARAIHYQSPRRDKPLVVINCSVYPATLLESELFGYEKGAFTGATRQKSGRFEQADGGTVFLDEIGEMDASAQIKLLRVLQTHKFERLGGEQTLSVDVRILAATNKDLLEQVKNGAFREDLYYRLNVIPIHLPPLRSRRNDIPLLAQHFQHQFTGKQVSDTRFIGPEVMRLFMDYHWPGNVRELENVIEHAVVLSKGRRIEIPHLPDIFSNGRMKSQLTSPTIGTLMENEHKVLMDALEACNWNKSQAAKQLGVSRGALYRKLRKYQINNKSQPLEKT